VYVRAEAYLTAQQGPAAVAEFQKMLDHGGLLWNYATGALAHLGITRAYVLQGDTMKAHVAYQDFLTRWKDADPDIPILIAAKAEWAAPTSSSPPNAASTKAARLRVKRVIPFCSDDAVKTRKRPRPRVEPTRNPTLFEISKLEQAGNLVSKLNVERPYSEPGLLFGT
jgi:hypothetical protein